MKHDVTATVLKYAHRKVQVFKTKGTGSTKMTKKSMRIFVGTFYVGVKSLVIMYYCDVFCLWLMYILVLTRYTEMLIFLCFVDLHPCITS